MRNTRTRNWKRSSVSHAPFATVGRKSCKCPACGWAPDGGGLCRGRGIKVALRIHCYREHGLRLALGDRRRLPRAAAAIDLDAEVAAHLWVVEAALERFDFPGDEAMQEARMALTAAILMWDRARCASFCNFAKPIIRKRAGRARAAAAEAEAKPAGSPLRVMLPPSPDPADAASVTMDDVAKAMQCLSDMQRKVLGCLFGESPMTLVEAGQSIGLSKERARQIKIESLRRLRMEITGEKPPPPNKKPKPRKPKKRSRPPWSGPPRPGRFVVLWNGAPTRMDHFGTLRPVSDGEDVPVFTDRRLASRLAHNLKVRRSKKKVRRRRKAKRRGASDSVTVVDVAELPALLAGKAWRLVDALPPMKWASRKSMTIDAVRDELVKHGPMTVQQISRRLIDRDGYMATRHPNLQPHDAEKSVCLTVQNAMKHVARRVGGGRRTGPVVYDAA